MRAGRVLLAAVIGGVLVAPPAVAAVAAAGPGGFTAGFATPVVVIAKGESITFVNGDIPMHDFVSDGTYVPKKLQRKTKWCSAYPKGRCPLFWSPRIGAGKSTEVLGLARVTSGKQYGFFCTLHPNMKGTLVVR